MGISSPAPCRMRVAAPASQKNERDTGDICDFALCRLPGPVARRHVGNLMRHHAGQFRFGVGL